MDKEASNPIFDRRTGTTGLRQVIFLSLGIHGLTAMILMTALATTTPPRLARDIDPCIHVDLVSLAALAAPRERIPSPPAGAAGPEKPLRKHEPLPAPPPAAPAKTAPGEPPRHAAAVLASLGRVMPFGHDGVYTGEKAGNGVATGREGPGAAPATNRAGRPGERQADGSMTSLAVPRYHENPHPDYPRLARLRGHEGVVLLAVEVLPDGKVGRLRIKSSSGSALLDQSALTSLKKWSFEPGRKLGVPVTMWVDVPIRFRLN